MPKLNNSSLKPDKQNRKGGKIQYISENGEIYDLNNILEYIINLDKFKKEVREELDTIKGCLKGLVKNQLGNI